MKYSDRNKSILEFIKNFEGAHDTFMYGCCYWFAVILQQRFNGEIYYDPVINHFATKIRGKLYDCSGMICDDGFISWSEYQLLDPKHSRRITRYCIKKVNNNA